MNIGIISNHYKTETWFKYLQDLNQYGHEVFWISVGYNWSKWLLDHGVEKSQLLDITSFANKWICGRAITEDEFNGLNALEQESGLNTNNIILMDRLLRLKPTQYAYRYLSVVQEQVTTFLRKNNVKALFTERTWAHEIVTAQVCKTLGVRVLDPHVARIPDGRFVFFEGFFEDKIFEVRKPESSDYEWAENFLKEFKERKPKPSYFTLNNKHTKFQWKFCVKLLKNFIYDTSHPFDENKPDYKWLTKQKSKTLINSQMIKIRQPFEQIDLPAKRPFVLFTLHVQPEASVDVLGSFFSNQIETVKAIARTLPITHDLYVKEHSNAIGNRSIRYYNELKHIPGVKLIDPYINSFDLIKMCDLVISISGTVSYEATLLGVPAMTIAPMFFGPLLVKNGFNPYTESIAETLKKCKNMKSNKIHVIEFLAWIYAQSFKGNTSDIRSDPQSVTKNNVADLKNAFCVILKKLESEFGM
ncbi:DUF354 domain-containing protein [Desulfoplanes sp. PS50]